MSSVSRGPFMSEEDIKQYFIQNGGVVRNTDIVNFFRPYLSNPSVREEARTLFKQYVNKLASVKVENGEKFLVLKRQYFPPIDGNGGSSSNINSNVSSNVPAVIGLPKQPSLPSYPSTTSITSAGYGGPYAGGGGASVPPHFSSPPNPYGGSSSRHEHPSYGHPYQQQPLQATNINNANSHHLRRQNSQPQLYGSHFSLNSNYADPYSNNVSGGNVHNNAGSSSSAVHHLQTQSTPSASGVGGTANFYPASHYSQSNPSLYMQPNNNNNAQVFNSPQYQSMSQNSQYVNQGHNSNYNSSPEYPPEFGLPTMPLQAPSMNSISSPPRRFTSPPNPYGSPHNNSGSPSSRAPPPYRPPPPAGRFATSPTGPPPVPNPHAVLRRSSMSSSVGVPNYNRTNSVPVSAGPGPGSYYSTSSSNNINIPHDPPGMFHYQRSLSVTGLPGAANSTNNNYPSNNLPGEHARYFDNFTSPPGSGFIPAVPPRSKRSVERSPSSANSLSSSSSSTLNSNLGLRPRFAPRMDEDMNGMSGSSQPQQLQRNVNATVASGQTMTEQIPMKRDTEGNNEMIDTEQEKENINHDQRTNEASNRTDAHYQEEKDGKSVVQNGNSEVEHKGISVKERMKTFNRIASESELPSGVNSKTRNRREIATKHESGDFDTASLSSLGYGFSHVQLDPKAKEWMMKAIKCDYNVLNKMVQENPALVRRKDMHTALHWAAKHGNIDCVKLLAGSFKSEVNAKSNGGYTPLHLAAQFGRQEVYDLLLKSYNADASIRDHSGKKPMQYLVRQDTMSMESFKKLKDKRRTMELQRERDSSFLRIGSLNVKVKSTREAFGYLLGKSTSSASIDRVHKNWGSVDNIPEVEVPDKDKNMMPPPAGIVSRHSHYGGKPSKRRSRRAADSQIIKESRSDSDSDSAFGFGSEWSGTSPVRD